MHKAIYFIFRYLIAIRCHDVTSFYFGTWTESSRLWGPPSPLSNGYQGLFLWE